VTDKDKVDRYEYEGLVRIMSLLRCVILSLFGNRQEQDKVALVLK
jgi:hypothetical protein